MLEKLEQLRAKPDHVKRMISAGVAGGVTLVIVLFWVVSLSVTNSSSPTLASNASAGIAASPFSALTASAVDAFSPIETAFSDLKAAITGQAATSSNAIYVAVPAGTVAASQASATGANMNTVNQ